MKFYLIDDDQNILNILKLIIKNRNLGEICGTSLNPADALEDLKYIQPDIVIVDLLMPIMDGISFVKKAAPLYPNIAFIMLSQVAAKDMISSAYESGIEFFIQKPINSIEVENVIRNVSQKLSMQRAIGEICFLIKWNNSIHKTDKMKMPRIFILRKHKISCKSWESSEKSEAKILLILSTI